MNLKAQILLAGLLVLLVPIIAWKSVKHLDESLRQSRINEQSLKVMNDQLELSDSNDLHDVLVAGAEPTSRIDLYAEHAKIPLFVDGYDDEWRNLKGSASHYKNRDNDLRVRMATRDSRLFLFLSVFDNTVVYHKPPIIRTDLAEGETIDREAILINGDSIELLVENAAGQLQRILFKSEAPGPVVGIQLSASKNGDTQDTKLFQYQGFWAATEDGFQLEISMPLPSASSYFGVAFADVDGEGQPRDQWLGSFEGVSESALLSERIGKDTNGRFYFGSAELERRLKSWVPKGSRLRLFDQQGRLLSDVNALYEKTAEEFAYDPAEGGFFNAIIFRIFGYFVNDVEIDKQVFDLRDGLHLPVSELDKLLLKPSATNRYITNERDSVLGTFATIGTGEPRGYMLYESSENLASAYSASQLARTFCVIALLSVVTGIILLIFAVTKLIRNK